MPDANLYRQNVSGMVFWAGMFEGKPVSLLLIAEQYVLFEISGFGSLNEIARFSNGVARHTFGLWEMRLRVDTGAYTAYITKIFNSGSTSGSKAGPSQEQSSPYTWYHGKTADGKVHVGVDFGGGFKDAANWYESYFGKPFDPGSPPTGAKTKPKTGKLDPRDDCFAFLGLETSMPSENEIKTAFRTLIKKWHPDRNPDKKSEAEEMTRNLDTARNEAMRRRGFA